MSAPRRIVGRLPCEHRAPLLASLALMALLFRALLPPGFMVVASDDPRSLIAMTMCSGVMSELSSDAAPNRAATALTDEERNTGTSVESHPCAFSGLAVLALAEPFDDPGVQLTREIARQRFDNAPAPGRGLAAPPPPATGPPVLI